MPPNRKEDKTLPLTDTQPIPGMCQWHSSEIESIKRELYGNGQEGLLKTVTKFSAAVGGMDEKIDEVISSISALDKKVTDLTRLVEKHQEDKLLHTAKGLIFNDLGTFSKIAIGLIVFGASLAGVGGIIDLLKWLLSLV
jgi:hypothetical protein